MNLKFAPVTRAILTFNHNMINLSHLYVTLTCFVESVPICNGYTGGIYILIKTVSTIPTIRKILFSMFLFSYANPSSIQDAKLVWFVTDPQEQENVEKLLLRFEKSYSSQKGQIQILFENEHFYDSRIQEILEQKPDLITLFNGFVARGLMKSGLLQNLEILWKKNNLDFRYNSSINTVSLGDRPYALTITYQDPIVFLYRKSLVKKYKIRSLPKTWVDFQKICQDLSELQQVPILTGFSDEQSGWLWLQALLPGLISYPEFISLITTVEKPADRLVEILDILDLCRSSNFFNMDAPNLSHRDALYKFVQKKEGVFCLAKRSSLENFSVESQKDIGYFFLPDWSSDNSSTAFMSVKSLFCFQTGYQKEVVRHFLQFMTKKSSIKSFHKHLFYKIPPQDLNFFSTLAFWDPNLKKQYLFKKSNRYFINDFKKELPESLYQSMRIFVFRNILQKSGIVDQTLDDEWKYHVAPQKQ